MFTAAELIEALTTRARRRFPLHAERPFGEFPPTWRAWFLSLTERLGAVTGAPPGEFLAVLAARTLRAPPKATSIISRLRAFLRQWRQQWDAPLHEERWRRRFAFACSVVFNLMFVLMVVIISIVQIGDAPPEARQAGEATLIEYIGQGTPVEQGGAPAPGETDAPAASGAGAAGQPAPASAASVATASAQAIPQVDTTPLPPQPADAASSQQPLVVTETPAPDTEFTLPAATPQSLDLPQLRVDTPRLSTDVTEIETFNPTAQVQSLQPPTPRAPALKVPTLRTEATDVEIYQPLSQTQVQALSTTPTRTQQLREQALRNAAGEVQLRAPTASSPGAAAAPAASTGTASTAARSTASGTTSGTAPSAGRTTAAPAATSGGKPQAQGAGRVTGVAPSGAGVTASPRPGALPSPVRGDDWGNSDRNAPGNSTTAGRGNGLFNDDGSVRVPGGDGNIGGGLPPGTIIEDFEKIDRMGTWLKRPPLDYTPSRFDRFWLPKGTLLDDWVRRGIKKVAIPIPGTTKRIECTVSLLQAGGGCRVVDPNLQDQEAIARPPPDVPFKPELQEDPGVIKTP